MNFRFWGIMKQLKTKPGCFRQLIMSGLRLNLLLIIFMHVSGTTISPTLNIMYVQGGLVFREEFMDTLSSAELALFCSTTNYYNTIYQERWDIKRQLIMDKQYCNTYKVKFRIPKQKEFPTLEPATTPTIIPALAVGGLGFNVGQGQNREAILARLDPVTKTKHCRIVKAILLHHYIPEFNILDQLLMDNTFCLKTKVANDLKRRNVTLTRHEAKIFAETSNCTTSNIGQNFSITPPPKPNDFKLPWTHCRLLINEINTNTPNSNIGQFLELLQGCFAGKYSRQDNLVGFWILVIKGETNEVILSQSLDGQTLKAHKENRKTIKMFTIAANGVPRADLNFGATAIVGGSEYLPIGDESPYAVVLLFGDPSSLKALTLNKQNGQYIPLVLTGELVTLIKNNLQDIVVYGSSPIHQKCAVFEQIYPPFAASDCTNDNIQCVKYLQRDWQNPNAKDKSLSRCTQDILPVLPESFLYTEPTPGLTNDCDHGFPFQMEENMMDISDVLERLVGTNPTDERCRSELYSPMTFSSVQADKYQARFQQAEETWMGMSFNPNLDEDSVMEMEIDRMDDSIAAVGTDPNSHPWQCGSENPYDKHPEWKKNIETHQKNVLDLKTIESCRVKPWIWYYTNTENPQMSTYGCKFCSDMVAKGFVTARPSQVKPIMRPQGTLINDGQKIPERNARRMTIHPDNPYHKLAMHFIREQEWYATEEELIKAMEQPGSPVREYYRATEEVIAATYQAVKMNLSFEQFEDFIQYIKYRLKGNVGIHYHDSKSMQKIALMISDEMHHRLVNHLLVNQPEISIILDSSDDNEGRHYMTVLFQTLDKRNRPHVFFYKLLEIGVSETGEQLFKLLWDAVTKDGLQDYFKTKLRGFSSDGAAVVKSKLLNLLKKNVNPNIIGNHCAAHRLDLVTKHAFEAFPFISKLDDVVNDQHNYLNGRSLKLHAKLREITIQENDSFFKLHKLFPVRWISSKFESIKPILDHWATLIATYTSIFVDPRFKQDQKIKANDLKTELLKRPVLSTLHKIEDLCELFKTYSKNFQSDTITPIPLKEYKKSMHNTLENQKKVHGTMTEFFFHNLECEKNGQIIFPCTLKDYEDKETKITYFGYELLHVDDPEYPKLSTALPDYIDALHGQLLKYFPDDMFDNFDIFYPKSLPSAQSPWNDYGKEELKSLKQIFNWKFSEEDMLKDWKALIDSIRSKERLRKLQEKPIHDFWYYNYNDAEEISWTDITREIIRTVQIIPGSTAAAERIFSFVNLIKSSRRANLSPDNLEALLRIKYNGPDCLHDIDLFSYAKEWCKNHATADDTTRPSYQTGDYRRRYCQQCNSYGCDGGVLYHASTIF